MKVIVAEDVGFCFGVQRALKMINSKIANHEKIYTLGDVVHNKSVARSLEQKGVVVIQQDIPQDAKDSVLVIRAHGVPKDLLEQVKKTFKTVVDTTCPIVMNLFKTAQQMQKQGYKITVFGKKDHPEMVALLGYVPQATVTVEPIPLNEKSCVLSQTTMSVDEFHKFVERSIEISSFKELRVINTICSITAKRESQTRAIAQNSDLVIVLGGKNSSNTSKLAKIASQLTKTLHIEEPSEVDQIDLSDIKTIGIVTGTSTPQEDVKILTEKILNRREKK